MRIGNRRAGLSAGAIAWSVMGSAAAQQHTVVGCLPNGIKLESTALRGDNGAGQHPDTGAALHSLAVPDRDGKPANVVFGDKSLETIRPDDAIDPGLVAP